LQNDPADMAMVGVEEIKSGFFATATPRRFTKRRGSDKVQYLDKLYGVSKTFPFFVFGT
jgi:hypothetical protein